MSIYCEAEKQLVASLQKAHPDLHLQDIYARPEIARLYRAAWKDAPAEARAMIDAHFDCYWRRPANKTAERFALLCYFYKGGVAGLCRHIASQRETHLQLCKANEAATREREQRKAEEQKRREEASKRTPEEWQQYRADYRRRRLQRAMQLMEDAMQNGVQLKHKGRCFFCAYPLTDPVSQLYGIGPDCRQSLVITFGEPKSAAFFEQLKLNTAGEPLP